METTLSGEFTEFSADFSHADELGGRLTSLIEDVNTHSLVRDVRVDLPGRDSVRDFLAFEHMDGGALLVYESSSLDTEVTDKSAFSAFAQQSARIIIDVPVTADPLFVKKPDPFGGNREVVRAVRSDGKVLPLDNAWFSKSGQGSDTEYFVNVFDVNGGGRYNDRDGSTIGRASCPDPCLRSRPRSCARRSSVLRSRSLGSRWHDSSLAVELAPGRRDLRRQRQRPRCLRLADVGGANRNLPNHFPRQRWCARVGTFNAGLCRGGYSDSDTDPDADGNADIFGNTNGHLHADANPDIHAAAGDRLCRRT